MQTEYEDKFAPRVLAFTRTLGYAGEHNARLQNFVSHIHDLDSINTIRAQLWKEALMQTDIDMQGNEMKHEYREGPEALRKFEDGMKKLFQAPKPAKSPFKPPAKPKPTSKD